MALYMAEVIVATAAVVVVALLCAICVCCCCCCWKCSLFDGRVCSSVVMPLHERFYVLNYLVSRICHNCSATFSSIACANEIFVAFSSLLSRVLHSQMHNHFIVFLCFAIMITTIIRRNGNGNEWEYIEYENKSHAHENTVSTIVVSNGNCWWTRRVRVGMVDFGESDSLQRTRGTCSLRICLLVFCICTRFLQVCAIICLPTCMHACAYNRMCVNYTRVLH